MNIEIPFKEIELCLKYQKIKPKQIIIIDYLDDIFPIWIFPKSFFKKSGKKRHEQTRLISKNNKGKRQ